MHFISQATPDIWKTLEKLEAGPRTLLSTLVEEDFKVHNKQYFTEEARKYMRLILKKAFDCIDSPMTSRGPWRTKKADSM